MDYSTWTSGKTFSVGDSLGESLSLSTRYWSRLVLDLLIRFLFIYII
jgi:hypothetical protein